MVIDLRWSSKIWWSMVVLIIKYHCFSTKHFQIHQIDLRWTKWSKALFAVRQDVGDESIFSILTHDAIVDVARTLAYQKAQEIWGICIADMWISIIWIFMENLEHDGDSMGIFQAFCSKIPSPLANNDEPMMGSWIHHTLVIFTELSPSNCRVGAESTWRQDPFALGKIAGIHPLKGEWFKNYSY